jgi:adenylylsulfate kinase
MKGLALWITGLPGSGKSTIADEIIRNHPSFVLLRMDEFRKIVTPEPAYTNAERDIVYRALVYMAVRLTELGHNVVIDATGNLGKWRGLARKLIPRYAEIYLKCPVDICVLRESKRKDTREAPIDIYKKGRKGWPVPGINAPYEEPVNPELSIETERKSLEEAVRIVGDLIKSFQSKP